MQPSWILPSLHEHAPLQSCLCEWNPMHTCSFQQSQFALHILPPNFFDFLLVCRLLAPFHTLSYTWRKNAGRTHYTIINWHDLDQLDFFQSVVICCFLPSRPFNLVTGQTLAFLAELPSTLCRLCKFHIDLACILPQIDKLHSQQSTADCMVAVEHWSD